MHSGQWKEIFCLVETLFLSIFQTFLRVAVFFSSSGNVDLKQILDSGWWNPIFSPVLVKAFSVQCKLVFLTNPSFWLMEIDFLASENHLFQYLKYSFLWKQLFNILNKSFITATGNGFSVQWKRYSFIHIFLETIIAIRGRPIFKETSYFCQRKPFSSFFFQILIRMKVAFRSSEIAFFKKSFILASGNGFSINYKLCAFIRSFFLLVDTILGIRCKPILFGYFILFLTAEAVFPARENGFFIESFIPASGNRFSA